MDNRWSKIATDDVINKTISSLTPNGIKAQVVENASEAKKRVLELIPEGKEVFTTTSKTLEESGIDQEINESGKFDSIRNKLNKMDWATQNLEMQKLGAAPEYVVGSVHAVTEDGKVMIASNSGSQLAPYVYGATHVIWVVGAQKIVKDFDLGIKRIYEYLLPLESERAQKAYGRGSNVSKLLVINKETKPGRITLIFVKEKLGL